MILNELELHINVSFEVLLNYLYQINQAVTNDSNFELAAELILFAKANKELSGLNK